MKVGFIGCGNMGGALARAVSRVLNTKVYISDYNEEKAIAFAKEIGAEKSDNLSIAGECDFIFLGVKPNVVGSVLDNIKEELTKNSCGVLISMAAGVSLERLASLVGDYPIIRIMPNTPVSVGHGMISWCKNSIVTKEAAENFESILTEAGKTLYIDEGLIDAATAVAGCGPAFVYMFADALSEGGARCGLDRAVALTLAAETLKGAAEMVLKGEKSPEQLRIDVCSPGGSTIEGVHVLQNGSFEEDTVNAVIASFEKTKKLGS